MSDLRELYQQVILDHHKKPRNFHRMEKASHSAQGFNPLCGDKISLYVLIEDGVIKNAAFQGSGCAISTASASMMTESLKGKTLSQAEVLFRQFHDLVTGRSDNDPVALGKLGVFAGVREFPLRVKCATLAWHTLAAALQGRTETVATE